MTRTRSRGARVAALAVGALLIIGGVSGIAGSDLAISKVGAALAILAGLFFLRVSARSKS